MHGAFNHRGAQVGHAVHAAGRAELVPGMIEIEVHHDARFGVEAGERDEADPHGDAHVVAEQVEEPERPHQ